MKKCYINGMACISAQKTFNTVFLEEVFINEQENVVPAVQPEYKEFISPAAGRRMASGVKNGIAASAKALQEAGVQTPDAIITGSGMGCNIDSQNFLQAIIDNNEEFLTPTSFIQSTHNTVAAQIALGLQCKVYNFTYVNGAVSFESALIDAKLQIEESEASAVLVGGIEELAPNRTKLLELSGEIKDKSAAPFTIKESATKGAVYSEGSVFFVLADTKQGTTYAELKNLAIYNVLERDEVEEKAEKFLHANGLTIDAIDAVILGYNGDAECDEYYTRLSARAFKAIPQLFYKHLSGEHNSASAFGLWVAAHIIDTQQVPDVLKFNDITGKRYNNILLYNQYRGRDHSFTLIVRP